LDYELLATTNETGGIMSDEGRPDEEPELAASPELVNDLRKMEKEALLVPPQIDAAALSRPRLHLARVRDLRAHGRAMPVTPADDLALAAHSSAERERFARQLAPRGEGEPISSGRSPWILLLWAFVSVAAVLVSWFLIRWLIVSLR
jgi:hypothetical protein